MNRGLCILSLVGLSTACSGTGAIDSSRAGSGGTAMTGGAAGSSAAAGTGGASASGGTSTAGSPSTGGASAGGKGGSAGGKGGSAGDDGSISHPTRPLCPGFAPAPAQTSCNSTADCAVGQQCAFGDTQLPCTLGCAGPDDQCTATAPCPTGQVCLPRMNQGACSCGGGAMCIAGCSANSCGAGFSCAPSGFCVAVMCDAGFVCPAGQLCDPKGSSAESHGCRRPRCDEPGGASCPENFVCVPGKDCVAKQCSTGADCDCGACSPELIGGARHCVPRNGYCVQKF